MGGDGAVEALEGELAHRLHLGQVLHRDQQALGDQDLAGLGLPAEAGGEVGDGADGPVVPAALEADGPDGGVALGDADAEVEVVAPLAPLAEQLHDELAEWNRTLEQRVEAQVIQLERLERLKRFFSPQLAEMIVSGDAEDPLKSHRREVTVVFLDLRGFTSFAETSEPEEVMGVLREYHAEMGRLILAHEGTLERFTGDGMMIFFNDPVPVPDASERAVRMAVAMRHRVDELLVKWKKRGYDLDFGVGIAQGYATIGAIGFEGRLDYGAIGTVTNLAARLCGEAKPGQILISQRVYGAVEDSVEVEELGGFTLKGFSKPVPAFNVLRLKASGR